MALAVARCDGNEKYQVGEIILVSPEAYGAVTVYNNKLFSRSTSP